MKSPAEYLSSKGITYKQIERPAGVQLVTVCPWCNDKESFSINAATGAWSCLRANKCGRSGGFWALMDHYGDAPQKVGPAKPREYIRPKVKASPLTAEAMEYLTKTRKLKPETVEAWGLYSDGTSIAFPYHKAGIVVNVKYRHKEGGKRPYKKFSQEKDAEPCLFGHDLVQGTELIITEGEIDAMTLWQVGIKNAVSVPSGTDNLEWLDTEWTWLKKFKVIYLCFDADEAGQKAAKNVSARLSDWVVYIVTLPDKDPNKLLQLETPMVIQEAFQSAVEVKPEIFISAAEFASKVDEGVQQSHKGEDGAQSDFPSLDRWMRGFRPGELTVWSGRNGSGKSTIMLQLVNKFLCADNMKVCVASMEMLPEYYLTWMAMQALRSRVEEQNVRTDLYRTWARGLYVVNYYGAIPPEDLYDVIRYAARRYGVSQFVVDSLMKIKTPARDKYDHQANVAEELKNISMKEKVHIHLVAHPRKGDSDAQEPDKVDIRGASEITDLADNVIVLVRPKSDNGIIKLMLKKNRKYGSETRVELGFNEDWKLFYETKPNNCAAPNWLGVK